MTPAERLIVALDQDDAVTASHCAGELIRSTPIRFFKIGAAMLMDSYGVELVHDLLVRESGVDLFLDLKLYDTRDTVDRTVRRAFDLGARFITVHATPSVMEAAMRAKPTDPRCKVLAVKHLTDQSMPWYPPEDLRGTGLWFEPADGFVLPAWAIRHVHRDDRAGKVIVCPGISVERPDCGPDNHTNPATPAEAIRAGADYLVVGRPITVARDPVAAARAIITEIEEACSP